MSASAKAEPEKFFIGIDANAKPLEKLSTKITRKPAKGGVANAMFVQAAVEDLPAEFDGIANEIHINFPWGGLLRAVARGDGEILSSLRQVAAPGCRLRIVFGIDPARDRSEIVRLDLTQLSSEFLQNELIPRYQTAGFKPLRAEILDPSQLGDLNTSWARKLRAGSGRVFASLELRVGRS